MELTWLDDGLIKNPSRPFDCSVCTKNSDSIAKLRKCTEDRWDLSEKDGSIFPIRIHEGGGVYGFCPAKALMDYEAQSIFKLLMVSAETGNLYYGGGISDQPFWFIDLLSWFLAAYDKQKFISKVKMVLGDGKNKTQVGALSGNKQRRPTS